MRARAAVKTKALRLALQRAEAARHEMLVFGEHESRGKERAGRALAVVGVQRGDGIARLDRRCKEVQGVYGGFRTVCRKHLAIEHVKRVIGRLRLGVLGEGGRNGEGDEAIHGAGDGRLFVHGKVSLPVCRPRQCPTTGGGISLSTQLLTIALSHIVVLMSMMRSDSL